MTCQISEILYSYCRCTWKIAPLNNALGTISEVVLQVSHVFNIFSDKKSKNWWTNHHIWLVFPYIPIKISIKKVDFSIKKKSIVVVDFPHGSIWRNHHGLVTSEAQNLRWKPLEKAVRVAVFSEACKQLLETLRPHREFLAKRDGKDLLLRGKAFFSHGK